MGQQEVIDWLTKNPGWRTSEEVAVGINQRRGNVRRALNRLVSSRFVYMRVDKKVRFGRRFFFKVKTDDEREREVL